MLQKYLAAVLVAGFFLAGEVLAQQCFSGLDCTGDVVEAPGPSASDCCVGTDDGQSYGSPGDCTIPQCIVHGFEERSYTTNESVALQGINFRPNVKGIGQPANIRIITGAIILEEDTAILSDVSNFRPVVVPPESNEQQQLVANSALNIQVIPQSDTISLELDDRINLRFSPNNPAITPEAYFAETGEFIRDVTSVRIIDDDSLTINFFSTDYDVSEEDLIVTIEMTVRETQIPFTLTLTPTTTDDVLADTRLIATDYLSEAFTTLTEAGKATPGLVDGDYDDMVFVKTVPPSSSQVLSLEIRIKDDDINEIEQRFALVGELGLEVPDEFTCFRVTFGEAVCRGRVGTTGIRIRDNDPMLLGFGERRQTVSEAQAPSGDDRFTIDILITSLRTSEIIHRVGVRSVIEGQPIIEPSDDIQNPMFDGLFGFRETYTINNLVFVEILNINMTMFPILQVTIRNDNLPEDEECFDLSIFLLDPTQGPGSPDFMCNRFGDEFLCEHTICIEDDDEPFRVGFDQTMYTVLESAGFVEVCVNLTHPPDDIFEEQVTVLVFHNDSSIYVPPNPTFATPDPPMGIFNEHNMIPRSDYEEETQYASTIRSTFIEEERRQICYNQVVYDDERLEMTETSGLDLVLADLDTQLQIEVEPFYDDSVVFIIDDDNALVGLEMTFYEVPEDVGVVEVCAIVYSPNGNIECPIEFPFEVFLSTRQGSAVPPMDYVPVFASLIFEECETRRCVNISIEDDMTLENIESFNVILDRSLDLDSRIHLDPVIGEIQIIDNDRGVAGLERTFYSVFESDGSVDVCTTVFQPDSSVDCPIAFPFTIDFFTTDDSAVTPEDYVDRDMVLNFAACMRTVCVTVPIVNDIVLEDVERFDVAIRPPAGGLDSRITLDPTDGIVEIIDDGDAVVGLERTLYSVTEGEDSAVEVCAVVFRPGMNVACPITFPFEVSLSTGDLSAVAGMDYDAVINEILRFSACQRRQCVTIPILEDSVPEGVEYFNVTLERTPDLDPRITLNPVDGLIEIFDVTPPPGLMVNDTLTGNPLMTVPIFSDPDVMEGDIITSLCYEVHGEADKFFNLVSDTCVSVNAHYSTAITNSPNINLNIVDAIGVRAVTRTTNECVNIRVDLENCRVRVDSVEINGTYRRDRITVRRFPNRVRISVPNCDNTDLVMWLFCTSGRTEDPVTWEYFEFEFIRFVIMRGLNLAEESHGLIGQFWNVPIMVTENTGNFNNDIRNDDYIITVPGSPPSPIGSPSRSFVGLLSSVTWEFERRPCLYVGNTQAGPLRVDVVPNDSVIEGVYTDYEVSSMFSSDFVFTHFDITHSVDCIIDDVPAVAVVGLEETFYRVSETDGVVEVCVVVYEPNISCPIEFPFDIMLSTTEGSAVSSMDYGALSTIVTFGECDTCQCVDITIVDDGVLENVESFFVSLESTPGLDSRITLNPTRAEVQITDNEVPTPTLDLSVPSGPLYEGTSQTLTCTVTLPDTVDTDVNVTVQWTHNGTVTDVMTDGFSMRSPFISTLTLSPLSMTEAGQYSCVATADSSSHYITTSNQGNSSEVILVVTALSAPDVSITFSGRSVAGQSYSLQCSASVVDGLVVLPDMKIMFPNSTVISVANSTSVQHMFSPLKRSDGGQYTCTATINIPQAGIRDLQSSVVESFRVVDAYPVEDFEGMMSSGTSFTFSWSAPSIAADLTTGYSLWCDPLLTGIPAPETVMLAADSTSAVVTGLYSGVTYNCSIITITDEGSSQPQTLALTTAETAPSGAPEMFEAVAGQREVVFSWSPPPVIQRNGIITSHTLSCSPSPSSLPQTSSQSGPLTVARFSPLTFYSCSVVATNSQGSGPPANNTFTTQQDYASFQLRLSGLPGTCGDLVSSERIKLEDIRRTLLDQLTSLCPECGDVVIDRQSFACYPESPSHVTYRARLEGTSETDSDSLISLIEKWVRGGASIIVTGVLMTVDSECSVAISSLSEGECSTTPPPTTDPGTSTSTGKTSDNTGAIIGGVLAAIIIIALTVIAVIILILKNRRRNLSTKDTGKSGSAVEGVSIKTSDNAAYEIVKQGQGEPGEEGYELVSLSRARGPPVAKVEGTYEVPSVPPSCDPLPAVPLPVARTEDDEEEGVYEIIPGDK